MVSKYIVVGRQEIFYAGTKIQCEKYMKDVKRLYPEHIELNLAKIEKGI